jgi:hypothetical protein
MIGKTQYDMLEVMFFYTPSAPQEATLCCLQEALEPYFEVEPLELDARSMPEPTRQIVRIASVLGESFTSAAAFDQHLRELAGAKFHWQRIGAVRAGQFAAVRS